MHKFFSMMEKVAKIYLIVGMLFCAITAIFTSNSIAQMGLSVQIQEALNNVGIIGALIFAVHIFTTYLILKGVALIGQKNSD